ncbi:hypothetical protein AX16_007372 [Volvariella volvacea WC 439]|nr:hypothetical protein AX16_007372 [Volvariella volvacea WC 439]
MPAPTLSRWSRVSRRTSSILSVNRAFQSAVAESLEHEAQTPTTPPTTLPPSPILLEKALDDAASAPSTELAHLSSPDPVHTPQIPPTIIPPIIPQSSSHTDLPPDTGNPISPIAESPLREAAASWNDVNAVEPSIGSSSGETGEGLLPAPVTMPDRMGPKEEEDSNARSGVESSVQGYDVDEHEGSGRGLHEEWTTQPSVDPGPGSGAVADDLDDHPTSQSNPDPSPDRDSLKDKEGVGEEEREGQREEGTDETKAKEEAAEESVLEKSSPASSTSSCSLLFGLHHSIVGRILRASSQLGYGSTFFSSSYRFELSRRPKALDFGYNACIYKKCN